MGTRYDITKVTSWSTTTHWEAASILGCSYVTAVGLRTKLGLPKGPRQPGSGSNRYKNHPPAARKPWERVTDWGMGVPAIAALVGCSRTAVREHIKKHRPPPKTH